MKNYALITLLLSVTAFAGEWTLDKSHSSIGFSINHLMISETTGGFNDYTLNVKSDRADFQDVIFDVHIKTASIDTADAKRDEHLRSKDFFDSEKNPAITFQGKKFEKQRNGTYKVYGALTLNGVKKDVVFDGKFNGIVKDPWGGTRAGLRVSGDIDRYEYGLKYNSILESGGLAIGRTVQLVANIELIKK